ncbi:MAG TPA: adenylate/guanylate cyclase domain-containing protein [Gemmatimonadales bacterium]|jgi:adenylate cyclase
MTAGARTRHLLLGVAVGAVVAGLLLLLHGTYLMQALERKTLDARFRAFHDPARADSNIVIVDVDNLSLRLLRPTLGRFPWRREVWGRIVHYLSLGGAKVIAFDFTFPEPDVDHPADDSAFAQAAQAAGTVIQTVYIQPIEGPGDSTILEEPTPLLAQTARALGDINFTPDTVDGTLRRIPLIVRARSRQWPTLGLAAAQLADSARFGGAVREIEGGLAIGTVRVPAVGGELLVNWRGPYRDPKAARPETYLVYPAAQVLHSFDQLRSGETPELDPRVFKGKVVFIAGSGAGLFEARANPFGPNDPGVLIHATVADNLLQQDFLRQASGAANALAILAAALAAAVLVSLVTSAWMSAAAGMLLLALQLAVTALLFRGSHLWLDMAAPGMAIVLTFTGGMSLNYMTEGRRKRQIREMFSKYVAPEYVAQLADDPGKINLGGERAELSILFSDIRGFTSISEKMEPHQVIEFLNEYLTKMAAIVKHSGGTLDKFIGDAVMAFWGEPVRHADHADRAADCALAMRDATAELARQWVAEGKPDIHIGIGINTADVVVGNIGSLEHKLDYTVIGDGVNLASRLEGLNKEHGTTIIISETTRERLGDRFETRPLGDTKVKGKERALPIFELLGRRTTAVLLALLVGAATAGRAQQSQWSDAVYVPGSWTGGRLATKTTSNAATDSLALIARVDFFSHAPRWRAEIRRSTNGTAFADTPDILIGDGAHVVVLTQLGATPFAQHALNRDSLARAVVATIDAAGHRRGAATGRLTEKSPDGKVARVTFRRAGRGSFDEALLNPGGASASRNLLASNIRAVGDQRNASVVATAGARGVDQVNTARGQVRVNPDSNAVRRMEAYNVGAMALEEFLRTGRLGVYAVHDSTGGK